MPRRPPLRCVSIVTAEPIFRLYIRTPRTPRARPRVSCVTGPPGRLRRTTARSATSPLRITTTLISTAVLQPWASARAVAVTAPATSWLRIQSTTPLSHAQGATRAASLKCLRLSRPEPLPAVHATPPSIRRADIGRVTGRTHRLQMFSVRTTRTTPGQPGLSQRATVPVVTCQTSWTNMWVGSRAVSRTPSPGVTVPVPPSPVRHATSLSPRRSETRFLRGRPSATHVMLSMVRFVESIPGPSAQHLR